VTEPREYVMAGTEAAAESDRLALLEAARDPGTTRRLEALGVAPGWRCLEVGAGRGSIARWLADRAGPDGSIVAADIDTRFLVDMPANVEVRSMDIRADELETDAFDLVHCRAFLMHMPAPDETLAKLAGALRPGGVILAEEGDYGLYHFGGHPDAEALNEGSRQLLEAMRASGVFDTSFGRGLPARLLASGLELLGAEVMTAVSRPGEPGYEFARASALDGAPRLAAAGLLDDEGAHRLRRFFGEPGTVITGPSLVAAWGQKPVS
jgi:SAM-dependent methyltransferase